MKPTEGMGITVWSGSDRYGATVIEVYWKSKRIRFQRDTSLRTDDNGNAGPQEYAHRRNPSADVEGASLRPDGVWRITGTDQRVELGKRESYRDPHY